MRAEYNIVNEMDKDNLDAEYGVAGTRERFDADSATFSLTVIKEDRISEGPGKRVSLTIF